MSSRLNKRYVYNAETGQMDEVSFRPRSSVHDIMPDLPDFVSPVDGKVVHGRKGLREHNRRHGTTNIADYKETWRKAEEKRAEFIQGAGRDPRRTEAVVRAYEALKSGYRPRSVSEREFNK